MGKGFVLILMLIIGLLIGYWLAHFLRGYREKIAILDQPMTILTSEPSSNFKLPKGTVLYLDNNSGGEAFVRYRIYVNIEGANLKLQETDKPWMIAPLSVRPDEEDSL